MIKWPVLALGAALAIVGAVRLLQLDPTAQAAAGALLGAGLVILGAWAYQELIYRNHD